MKNTFTLLALAIVTFVYSQPQVGLTSYATGLNGAISDIEHAGDGRLFVTEQLGYIHIVNDNGVVNPRPFLDIHSNVTPQEIDSVKEQGLLGLAFSPNYETDGNFYVHYTDKTGLGNVVVSRFHVSSDPDSADRASEQILLRIYKPFTNHNGGCIKFGPDGFLYIGLGDGGGGGDPDNRAQNLDSLQGKILRLDVSGSTGYSIPPGNPFVNNPTARPEIWAYGLRNPWRFSFDRLTNNLWIADVGEQTYEEIDLQNSNSTGGENYGWRCYEGNHTYNSSGCAAPGNFTPPVYEYSHASVSGCSITGGYVYRGTAQAGLYGYYFYADYCNSTIYTLTTDGNFVNGVAGVFNGKRFTTFGENKNGELFIGDHTSGTVYRITDNPNNIDKLERVNNFMVYPSPATNKLVCDFSIPEDREIEFSINDITGRIVYTHKEYFTAGKNTKVLNTSHIPDGVYVLQLRSTGATISRRFMKTGD